MPIYEFGLLFIVVTLGLGYLLLADGVLRGTSFFHRRQMDEERGRNVVRRLFTSLDTLIVLAIIVVIAFLIFSPLLSGTGELNR